MYFSSAYLVRQACMHNIPPRHKHLRCLVNLLQQCILATCTLCCYNPLFCCLHAVLLLQFCYLHASTPGSAAYMYMLPWFCCLHGSVLLLACFSSAACMLPWFCCFRASIYSFAASTATMVLMFACFHSSAACMLSWFCCLHAQVP